MTVYLIIFLLFVLSSFIESIGAKISALIFLMFTVFLLLLITALREGMGNDFYSYKGIFSDVTQKRIFSTEIGYTFLNFVGYYLGGFKSLLFITALINLLSFAFILKRLKLNISLGLLSYYCLFYINHNFNTIRHGLMASLVWIALYFFFENKKVKSLMIYGVGMLFHQLAIVFIPFQYLTKQKVGFVLSLILIFVLYMIGGLMENAFQLANVYLSQFTNKLDYYLNDFYGGEVAKYEFGLGFILYLAIYFIILFFEKRFENRVHINYFNRILFAGICVILLFSSVSIFVERIANVFLMSLIFIFASINQLKLNSIQKFILLAIICSINFFYLYRILHIPGGNQFYQFLPYQFSL